MYPVLTYEVLKRNRNTNIKSDLPIFSKRTTIDDSEKAAIVYILIIVWPIIALSLVGKTRENGRRQNTIMMFVSKK